MNFFITGISSGIGRELTKLLIQQNHAVWGIAPEQDKLENLSQELNSPLLKTSVCDITNSEQVSNVDISMKQNGFKPEVVILNAAIDLEDLDSNFDSTIATKVLKTNIEGSLVWVDKLMPVIKHTQGQFVAISSILAHWPDTASLSYGTSKAALTFAFRTLRLRYAKSNIKFKTVFLGPVATLINPRFTKTEENFIVRSPAKVVKYVSKVIKKNRNNFYYPWYTTVIRIFLWWLPDSWFENLTKNIRR